MEESSYDLKRPEGIIHKRVMSCFRPFFKRDFFVLAINVGILFLGYLMMFITYTFSSKVSWAMGAAAYILVLASLTFRFIRCIELWFYSDFPLIVETIIDCLINVIALALLFAGVLRSPAVQIVVAVLFLFNLALTLYSYMDTLALHSRLVKKKYLVGEGVVIYKEKKTVGARKSRWVQHIVVVRSSNGSIRPVEWVLRRQYNECSIASSVLMVIPDPVETQINSSIRLAVEPFGRDE